MKHCALILFVCIMAIGTTVLADAPQLVNYQGRLTNSAGEPLDTTMNIIFSICTDEGGMTCLWGETHTDVEIVDGQFGVLLGQFTAFPDDLWDESRYLHIMLGGQMLTPATRLASAPWALRAETVAADAVTSIEIEDGSITLADLGQNGAAAGDCLKWNGTAWVPEDCVPKGTIIMWTGAETDMPRGWALCDGSAGTPDLLSKCIIDETSKTTNVFKLAYIVKL